MSTPSPEPGPSGTTITAGGNSFTIPPTDSSSTSSKYNTGVWANQAVNATGWATPGMTAALDQSLQAIGVDPSGTVTGDQLAEAISRITDKSVVAQIQQMLLQAGAYSSDVKSTADLTLGTFGPKDHSALGAAIVASGQNDEPFGTYLTTSANYGKANGQLTALLTATKTPITAPNPIDEDAALTAAAKELAGVSTVDPQLKAKFRAYFTSVWVAAAKQTQQAALAGDITSNLPSVDQLGQALTDQANGVTQDSQDAQQAASTNAGVAPPLAPGGSAILPGQTNFRRPSGPTNQGPISANALGRQTTIGQSLPGQDVAAISSYNDALTANSGAPVITGPPDIGAAAEQFFQQNEPGAIQANNTANKYATLVSLLKGGS